VGRKQGLWQIAIIFGWLYGYEHVADSSVKNSGYAQAFVQSDLAVAMVDCRELPFI